MTLEALRIGRDGLAIAVERLVNSAERLQYRADITKRHCMIGQALEQPPIGIELLLHLSARCVDFRHLEKRLRQRGTRGIIFGPLREARFELARSRFQLAQRMQGVAAHDAGFGELRTALERLLEPLLRLAVRSSRIQQLAEVVIRCRARRLDGERFLVRGERAGRIAARLEPDAEVEMSLRKLRREADGPPIKLAGAREIAGILGAIAFGDEAVGRISCHRTICATFPDTPAPNRA